jgi:hypothetical protein
VRVLHDVLGQGVAEGVRSKADTPVNSPASAPVRLAVLSEELGFDLVTLLNLGHVPQHVRADRHGS